MTARSSWIQRNTGGHRPPLQFKRTRSFYKGGFVAMTLFRRKDVVLLLLIVSVLMAASCKKRVAAAPPPPPPPVAPAPPAPAPAITLRAQPATIERGQSSTLQWEARNAATV